MSDQDPKSIVTAQAEILAGDLLDEFIQALPKTLTDQIDLSLVQCNDVMNETLSSFPPLYKLFAVTCFHAQTLEAFVIANEGNQELLAELEKFREFSFGLNSLALKGMIKFT